ncbi:MAG: hypothetical protein NEHIOOID_00506 [Holosporales bacterium]
MTSSPITPVSQGGDLVSFIQSINKTEFFLTIGIIFGIYVFLKIFNRITAAVYFERHKRAIPHVYITLINLATIISTGTFVSVAVLDQPLNSIITAMSVVSVGLAFALQGPILDLFSGFTMDFENRIRQGDWIKLSSGIVGKVLSHNWRSLTIETNEKTIIIVPNSKLTQDYYEIITKNDFFWDEIKISIDYDLSIRRTARIIKEAVMTVEGVHNKRVEVFAMEANAGGVDYFCRFQRTDYGERKKICHDILMRIEEGLQVYNLGFSESLGEYTISFRKDMQPQWEKREADYELLPIVQNTSILGALAPHYLQEIIRLCPKQIVPEGYIFCKEGEPGDVMYILLEGSAKVLTQQNGENITLAYLQKFDYFGEMALFLNQPRSATVQAETSCLVLEVPRSLIVDMVQNTPMLLEQVIIVAHQHIKENDDMINDYLRNQKGKTLIEIVEATVKSLFVR